MSGQTQDIAQQFGAALNRAIVEREWTNEEAGRALGVTEKQIRRWRKGHTRPRRDTLHRINRELRLGLDAVAKGRTA